MDPAGVLDVLHGIEADLGRVRPRRWAPRVCDLDLLAAGEEILPDAETVRRWMELSPEDAGSEAPEELILPHPRMHERSFVLVPLADVAPGWRHPITGRTVAEMVAALPEQARREVVPLDPPKDEAERDGPQQDGSTAQA